ncbi:hypothetical protein Moror_14773 [Moniliophthora roreri MCA 2997]|uniref:cysteine dioxygenase n=1 Tax=Moniliophthora roreri (strain MCA 2997) TaxID=1381753 RepID=V2X3K7_MONRO|nr:hypothetical protein Moror_14773 [Moniliophthora roreri MCA 2997]
MYPSINAYVGFEHEIGSSTPTYELHETNGTPHPANGNWSASVPKGTTKYEPPTLTSFDNSIDNDPEKAARAFMITKKARKLPIGGQGVAAVEITPGQVLWIVLSTQADPQKVLEDSKDEYLAKDVCIVLQITEDGAKLTNGFDLHSAITEEIRAVRGTSSDHLVPGTKDIFWLSLSKDGKQAGELRYGRTYRSTTCTLLMTNVGNKEWVEKLQYVHVLSLQGSAKKPIISRILIDRYPVVYDLPPVIADNNELTLLDIDINSRTSIANLHPVCQRLYGNIAGPAIKVNDHDFPDFTDAIEWGIKEPTSMIYKKLLKKSGEFSDEDPNSVAPRKEVDKTTYLRVTLGMDEGRSPGIPYVMEIWPAGHQSPIHNHGDAYAVIKVLHGEIHSRYFKTLDGEKNVIPYRVEKFRAGNVTWMDPEHYQVHQLQNRHKYQVCVTIQCYGYSKDQDQHHEQFTYLKEKEGRPMKDTGDFTPDSDWAFHVFRRELKAEWEAWKAKHKQEELL